MSGAQTILNGRTQETPDRAISKTCEIAPDANLRGVPSDLGTRAGVDRFVQTVPDVDTLVNNLGVFGPGDLFGTKARTFRLAYR